MFEIHVLSPLWGFSSYCPHSVGSRRRQKSVVPAGTESSSIIVALVHGQQPRGLLGPYVIRTSAHSSRFIRDSENACGCAGCRAAWFLWLAKIFAIRKL